MNLECIVRQSLRLGSHDLFIGEVVVVHADEDVVSVGGRLDFSKIKPFAYCSGQYWNIGQQIGTHGFTASH